jgi:hypothetical protein
MAKIKYHDNINGAQYDENGILTDNWKPEENNQENRFLKVYFRTDCPAYTFTSGGYCWTSTEAREAWAAEMADVLEAFSIPAGVGHPSEKIPGAEHLYAHPQSVSGVVEACKIKKIAEALSACKTCSIRWVDIYQEISAINDKQFISILDEKKPEIKKDILEAFKTKRGNLYIVPSRWSGAIAVLSKKYSIPRKYSETGTDEVCSTYLLALLGEMAESGEIKTARTKAGIGYRSPTKKEVAAHKLESAT